MNYTSSLIAGRLIRRYKRFLADIELEDGSIVVAHCANTGAMTGCQPDHARVWLSPANDPRRKTAYSWELVEVAGNVLCCINTSLTNKVVAEAIKQKTIAELADFDECRSEVKYGEEGSRIDFLLRNSQTEHLCFVEVKHVTLQLEGSLGAFPDAKSTRGQKHLRELMEQRKQGHRAVLLFVIMRSDITSIQPADHIDEEYGRLLRQAADEGVEILVYSTLITLQSITLAEPAQLLLT